MTTPPEAPSRNTNPLADELDARAVQVARRVAAHVERLDGEARAFERGRPLRLQAYAKSSRSSARASAAPDSPPGARARLRPRRTRAPACRTRAGAEARPCGRSRRRSGARPRPDRDRIAVDRRVGDRFELLARVRRGVDEKPRPLAAADGQRRLRPGSRADARLGRPHTSGSGSSTEESPRRRPSRESERALVEGRSGAQPQAGAGGYASFTLLPVIQVGSDLRAHLDELKLRLDPSHRMPLLLEFNGSVLILHIECKSPKKPDDGHRGN